MTVDLRDILKDGYTFEDICYVKQEIDFTYNMMCRERIKIAANKIMEGLKELKAAGGDFRLDGWICDIQTSLESDAFSITIDDLLEAQECEDGLYWYSKEKDYGN